MQKEEKLMLKIAGISLAAIAVLLIFPGLADILGYLGLGVGGLMVGTGIAKYVKASKLPPIETAEKASLIGTAKVLGIAGIIIALGFLILLVTHNG